LVIRCLFDPNLVQVPNVDSPITGRRREDGGVVWRPRETQDLVGMGLKCVHAGCWFTQIVETNCLMIFNEFMMGKIENPANLVRASCDDEPLLRGVVSN
jgi:hypothetical protein